jgi:hypothetical protein
MFLFCLVLFNYTHAHINDAHPALTLSQPITTPVAGRANTAQPAEDTGTPSFSPLPGRWTPTASRHQIPQQEEQQFQDPDEDEEESETSSSSSSSSDSSASNSPIPPDQVTHPAHACVRSLFYDAVLYYLFEFLSLL